jgi:hypothetical protein
MLNIGAIMTNYLVFHTEALQKMADFGQNTGQLKKKVTLSHVYKEVTSEPTITRFSTVVGKTLKVCN